MINLAWALISRHPTVSLILGLLVLASVLEVLFR